MRTTLTIDDKLLDEAQQISGLNEKPARVREVLALSCVMT